MNETDQPNSAAMPPNRPRRTPLVRGKFLIKALFLAGLCFVFFKFGLMPVKILGESMQPTYRDGTLHFLNRMAYWSEGPQRGDVVGLQTSDGDIYIKRVVGLPGETVAISRSKVFINDQPLSEPYVRGFLPLTPTTNTLGSDEYFVMGDNRSVSVLGPLPRERILGKIVSLFP